MAQHVKIVYNSSVMKKGPLVISIVIIIAVIGIMMYFKNEPEVPQSGSKNTPTPRKADPNSTLQAWIYPGPPACDAMAEIQDGRKIDVLKPEYFKITEEGTAKLLTEAEDGCNAFTQQNLNLVKKYSSQQYITVASNHIDMRVLFADDKKIAATIKTLADFAKEYNVTGIEIDFEEFSAWTKKDYSNYKAFTTKLAQELHKNGAKLMIDGPALTPEMQQYYFWNYADFKDMPIDYVVVMAYDNQYDHGKGSFVAPNDWVKQVVEYTKEGLGGSNKLIVGIPSYGYHSEEDFKFALDTKQQSMKYPGFNTSKMDKDSFESWWENDGVFYVHQTNDGLKKKMELIKELGIQHISVWHLGGNDWVE